MEILLRLYSSPCLRTETNTTEVDLPDRKTHYCWCRKPVLPSPTDAADSRRAKCERWRRTRWGQKRRVQRQYL
ncbi:hypothetical protein DPMN_144361 [Dreissena polymorpha]|uniref:Uncharacterized protein n=1 Tax=Dreissena polymorpha TaxID=45954 RepID=A0A9D4GER5_DREPO|nr:hypothetical protein DPMN_144361 [Dreissena polymorpha]